MILALLRTIRALLIAALFAFQTAPVASIRAADEARSAAQPITRIWLSHVSPDPGRMTISFETQRDGDTVVEYGPTEALGETQRRDEAVRLHQTEVKIPVAHGPWFYRVRSGEQSSAIVKTRGYDEKELKVAVVGNLGYATGKWQEAILREQPHLLLSAGDNVGEVHAPLVAGQPRSKGNIANFQKLIDSSPQLFQTIPFMPTLGNHDREIRPRGPGPKPPEEKVYDVDATAYRKFFALPGDEWKWHFDFPKFGACFIALDLNHVQDHGTNWQTCHAYDKNSEQLAWYRATMSAKIRNQFVITLNNEKSSVFRGLADREWWEKARYGKAIVTGFGYFAERAMPGKEEWYHYDHQFEAVPNFNTSVGGKGAPYRDPKAGFFASEDNYLLFTFKAGAKSAAAELKSLAGNVLDGYNLTTPFETTEKEIQVDTLPLVIRDGGTPERPMVYDFHGRVLELGLDVSGYPWKKQGLNGEFWYSQGKLLGREPIAAGQTAGLFLESLPLSIPRNLEAEKLHPDKKGFCYVRPEELKPGQMGYADDGSVYFRWPTAFSPGKSRIIAPPAPGTSGVSIQCSHVVVKNLDVRHAANDGFNIHNKWVGVRLENVQAISNGDEGISAHGEVELTVVDSEVAFNGSAAGGVADVDKSVTRYERCRVHDNLGAAFYFSGKSHTVVDTTIERQARDFSVAPTSIVVKERVQVGR
jgi:hypothetical protein